MATLEGQLGKRMETVGNPLGNIREQKDALPVPVSVMHVRLMRQLMLPTHYSFRLRLD